MGKSRSHSVDRVMLALIGVLLCGGFAILASASFGLGERRFHDPYHFIQRQGFGLIIGIILFFIGLRIPVEWYRKTAPLLLIGSIGLLLFVFIPGVGFSVGGAARWIHIGSISFQPSEVLKFTFIVYLASWMTARKKEIHSMSTGLIPFLLITGFVGGFLVLEPDIGTLGVLALTALFLFVLGGGRSTQVASIILLGFAVLAVIIYLEPYRGERLFIFLNPGEEAQGIGYQINQALIAIGSGGIFGRGWGLSRQKFQYLPEPAGDAVFAIVAEELGLIGVLIILVLFCAFFLRAMMIAAQARDPFRQYLASGIALLVMVQVMVNIGAISGMLPLTGIPLPFISYGGSALAFLLFEMGVLLAISKNRQ